MNSTAFRRHLGLTLGAMGLVSLTACGGGDPLPPVAAVPTDSTTRAAAASLCGVQVAPAAGAESYTVTSTQDGANTLVSAVTSTQGHAAANETVSLAVPLVDLREVSHQPVLSPNATGDTMGVEMSSHFEPGSVGCVNGVARVTKIGTAANESYLLSWSNDTMPYVPVDAIPDEAINGFQFVNNFSSTSAIAVFQISKEKLVHAEGVKVCHFASTTSWNCSTPTVQHDDDQWTFRLPISQSGVYVLSAPRETLPVD